MPAVAAEEIADEAGRAGATHDARDDPARSGWVGRAGAAAVVAVVAGPIVVAALQLVGRRWYPVGDLGGLWLRIEQIGSADTPLTGAETVKGFAHPGPLQFYLAVPLDRLLGHDPRAMTWTASAIALAAVAGVGWVSWRRGGWPLLLGAMLVTAVVVQAVAAERITSFWNPLLPLMPFLCGIWLVWDIALGHRRAVLPAAVALAIAGQTHLAFLTLSGMLVVFLGGWLTLGQRWWPAAGEVGPDSGEMAGASRRRWARALAPAVVLIAVLAVPIAIDQAFGHGNVSSVLESIKDPPPRQVGLGDGISLVGRYVRPDGPWLTGSDPVDLFDVIGSGPVPVLAMMALLVTCLVWAYRTQARDVAALASMVMVLIIGSAVAAGQIPRPAFDYLTQFLKIVGAMAWFTVGWTVFRAVQGRRAGAPGRARVAAVAAIAIVVAVTAWSLPEALDVTTPNPVEERAVQELRDQLRTVLPDEGRFRVEYRGDPLNIPGPGVIRWLIEDGYDVVTEDGDYGLKWGQSHVWHRGDDVDQVLTVAVHYDTTFQDAYRRCSRDPRVRQLATYDRLSADERRFLEETRLLWVTDREAVSEAEWDRVGRLAQRGLRVAVFAGDRVCGDEPK